VRSGEVPDIVVYNLGFMLGASKRTEHRQACRDQCSALVSFLQDNGLVSTQLVAAGATLTDDFVLRESQLTEQGVLFVRSALRPWLAAQEKSRNKKDVALLASRLNALRRNDA
jgi:hypothetical protein